MSKRPHDEPQDQTALQQEVQALRETVAALTEQLKAQHREPQPTYSFMQPGDVAVPSTPPQDTERAVAIARDAARHARPEESAPRIHPPRFVTGGEVSWSERDEEGNELTPAEVRRRAEEKGAEALRRQDALRDLRR